MAQTADLSETGMANLALSMTRNKPITDLDANPSYPAGVVKKWFAVTRDALQRQYPWNFTKWYAQIARTADEVPAWQWEHFFDLPADYLAMREVVDCTDQDWEVVGPYIATDANAPLKIIYSRRVVEVPKWDALFRMLFIASLAAAIAPELTEDERIFTDIERAVKKAQDAAYGGDAMEGVLETTRDSDFEFIASRFR